jgi:hypothetical protein
MAVRWAAHLVALKDNLMAVLLVVMTVASLAGKLVVRWVDLKAALKVVKLVGMMDLMSAVHSAVR